MRLFGFDGLVVRNSVLFDVEFVDVLVVLGDVSVVVVVVVDDVVVYVIDLLGGIWSVCS